jgi:hypothetical protein
MLGLEPQKRKSTSSAQSCKVTKSKKVKKELTVKREATPEDDASPEAESPEVKHEINLPHQPASQHRLASATSICLADSRGNIHQRLPTPCSDTDAMRTPHQQPYGSPVSDIFHADAAQYDFATAGQYAHEHVSWPQAGQYSAYELPFNLDSYGAAVNFCEHNRSPEELCDPTFIMPPEVTTLKHEEW